MRIREKGGVKKEDVNSLKKNLSDRQKEGIKRKVEKSLNKSGSSSEGTVKYLTLVHILCKPHFFGVDHPT